MTLTEQWLQARGMAKSAGVYGDWIGNGNWRNIHIGNIINGVSPGEEARRRNAPVTKPAPDSAGYYNVTGEVKQNHTGESAKARPMKEYDPTAEAKAPAVDPNHIVGRPKPTYPFSQKSLAEAFAGRAVPTSSPAPVQGMARR